MARRFRLQYQRFFHDLEDEKRIVMYTAVHLSREPPVPFLPAALRAAQTCRYLVYLEANFEVFRPAGATRCTDGGEICVGEGVTSPTPNFTPIGATARV